MGIDRCVGIGRGCQVDAASPVPRREPRTADQLRIPCRDLREAAGLSRGYVRHGAVPSWAVTLGRHPVFACPLLPRTGSAGVIDSTLMAARRAEPKVPCGLWAGPGLDPGPWSGAGFALGVTGGPCPT